MFHWVNDTYRVWIQHDPEGVVAGVRIFWCHLDLTSVHVILGKAINFSLPWQPMWIPRCCSILEFCEIWSVYLSPSEFQGPIQVLVFFSQNLWVKSLCHLKWFSSFPEHYSALPTYLCLMFWMLNGSVSH